jgi:hypothetical protein
MLWYVIFPLLLNLHCARRRPDRGRNPCWNGANRLFCFDDLYFDSVNRRGRSSGNCEVCLVRPTNWCAIDAKMTGAVDFSPHNSACVRKPGPRGSPIDLDGIPTARSANHARAGNSALSRKTAIVQSLLRRVRTEADALGIRSAEASAYVSSGPPGSRVLSFRGRYGLGASRKGNTRAACCPTPASPGPRVGFIYKRKNQERRNGNAHHRSVLHSEDLGRGIGWPAGWILL